MGAVAAAFGNRRFHSDYKASNPAPLERSSTAHTAPTPALPVPRCSWQPAIRAHGTHSRARMHASATPTSALSISSARALWASQAKLAVHLKMEG